jgi:hypothetical protein
MNHNWLLPLLAASVTAMLPGIAGAQQIYKWTDASGQVHYSEKKPDDAAQTQTMTIAPRPPASPSDTDSAAEIARINALSEQMARERQAAEQARQEQAIRSLEQENKALENALLNQQLQEQQRKDDSDSDSIIIGPSYPYYPYPPYPPYPPKPPRPPWPCQPWPACHKPVPPTPMPTPTPQPSKPLAKPNPPFKPAPAGIAPEIQGGFRGR